MDERFEMRESWPRRLAASLRRLRCPAPAVIAAFVDGNLAPGKERRLRSHLASCQECSLAVTELRQLSLAPLPELPTALLRQARQMDIRRGGRSGPAPQWKLAGAFAVAGVATLLGFWLAGSSEVETRAGSEAVRAVRGEPPGDEVPAVVFPNQDAALFASAVRIEWTEVAKAVTYEVVVVDAEGGMVESLDAGESLSASPRSPLRPGTYFVSVAATLPDGRVVRSVFSRFTIRSER